MFILFFASFGLCQKTDCFSLYALKIKHLLFVRGYRNLKIAQV